MAVSKQAKDLIKEFEGLRLKAYLCPANVWTIGWGSTTYPDGRKVKKGDTCTEAQADSYLEYSIGTFQKSLYSLVKVPLNQNQNDALLSFIYNLGAGNLASSTLLRKLNAGDYTGAADQLPRWKYSKGKVFTGLVRRRAAERALFLKPVS